MIRYMMATVLILGFISLVVSLIVFSKEPATGEPLVIIQSADCQECHPDVYAEWKKSWHAMAWKDPHVRDKQQADNFKKKDCIPCHAPRPIFERGLRQGERVVERISNRDDGVDCISCHRLPQGGYAAANKTAQGPCGATFHPLLNSQKLCAPCHNQHKTVDEWMSAPPDLKKENCGSCHMPRIERKSRNGKPAREGRDHTFRGGHFEAFLQASFSLFTEIKTDEAGKTLCIRLANDNTGHNFPTDSRHRALDLVLTFFKKGGLPFPSQDNNREYGQESGTHRMRFRNPYRSETGKENTQIPAGEEAVLSVQVPGGAKKALIQVIYKLTPFMPDEEGMELAREEVTFQ